MPLDDRLPESPVQGLNRHAYIDERWLSRERATVFSQSWQFAGSVSDWKEAGDYKTVQAGPYPLFILRDGDGALRAFHNLCRHRGTELLEGEGNVGRTIVCPYHFWGYGLDGSLRGVPEQAVCFPDLDKGSVSLKQASVGIFGGLVFIHPDPAPGEPFESWLGGLKTAAWPHDLTAGDLKESDEKIVYALACNWKVFVENALDGYHLAYLHRNTLGGPKVDKNVWEVFGRHMVWYALDSGAKNRLPQAVIEAAENHGSKKIRGTEEPGYGGVYFFFPNLLITASPYSFTLILVEPQNADSTHRRVRNWGPTGWGAYTEKLRDFPGYDRESGLIRSSHWKEHPLETGDFQTEDVWVCEKMQRSLHSPAYEVGALAQGAGGEAPLAFFQAQVAEMVGEFPG